MELLITLFLGIIACGMVVLVWKHLDTSDKKAGSNAVSWMGKKLTTLGTKMSGEKKQEA